MGSMKNLDCPPVPSRQYHPLGAGGGAGKDLFGRQWLRRNSLPLSFLNDPKHWRQRAEEALTIADQMNDLQAKAMLIRISYDYESLAKRAEERELRHSSTA